MKTAPFLWTATLVFTGAVTAQDASRGVPCWCEGLHGGGDAGSLPKDAQGLPAMRPRRVYCIEGFIEGAGAAGTDFEDMYRLVICELFPEPAWKRHLTGTATAGKAFSATTSVTGDLVDPMLWLFDAAGIGAIANDNIGEVDLQSSIDESPDDGFPDLTDPGLYHLAISGYEPKVEDPGRGRVPRAAGLDIFRLLTREEQSGPDGDGAGNPISEWFSTTDSLTGRYVIDLEGVITLGRETSLDCNENGLLDACEMADAELDNNCNGTLDECDCPADLDGNGTVDFSDLLALLAAWGSCGDCDDCPADFNGDCVADFQDLLTLLSQWGACDDVERFLASDRESGDQFGLSVAASGEIALVGAPREDEAGEDAGAAYFFRQGAALWTKEQKVTAFDGVAGDLFGWDVAVDGDVAIVGAPMDPEKEGRPGAAYVYRWDGNEWTFEQKLTGSVGPGVREFGFAVAVSGDVAVVGAPGYRFFGNPRGRAYVFRWNGSTWTEEQFLAGRPDCCDNRFGVSVSVSGDVVFVGAEGDDLEGEDAGRAYAFRYQEAPPTGGGAEWVEELLSVFSGGQTAGALFGKDVAVSGDLAIVGATFEDRGGSTLGAVYLYRWTGASWRGEIGSEPLLTANNRLGRRVAMSGDVAVAGAPNPLSNGVPGSAYVYRWSDWEGWTYLQRLVAPEVGGNDRLGRGVAVSDGQAFFAAPLFDGGGSVYVATSPCLAE